MCGPRSRVGRFLLKKKSVLRRESNQDSSVAKSIAYSLRVYRLSCPKPCLKALTDNLKLWFSSFKKLSATNSELSVSRISLNLHKTSSHERFASFRILSTALQLSIQFLPTVIRTFRWPSHSLEVALIWFSSEWRVFLERNCLDAVFRSRYAAWQTGKQRDVDPNPKPLRNTKSNEFHNPSFPKLIDFALFMSSISKMRDAVRDGRTDTVSVLDLFHLIHSEYCTCRGLFCTRYCTLLFHDIFLNS